MLHCNMQHQPGPLSLVQDNPGFALVGSMVYGVAIVVLLCHKYTAQGGHFLPFTSPCLYGIRVASMHGKNLLNISALLP